MPPTVALVAECFGHQFGAALASHLGGFVRVSLGDYTVALLGAGILAILASPMVLVTRREPTTFGPKAARA